jgi:hypothetical protein
VSEESRAFVIEAETAWDPPATRAVRWRYLRATVDFIMAAGGSNTVTTDRPSNEPKWHVTMSDNGRQLAASRWLRDWDQVTRVQGDWEQRVRTMDPGSVRSQAHRWSAE